MKRLKELRKERKITQKEVAAYLGISQPAYANYERGFREPDGNTLVKLSEYFDVSIDYLLGTSDYKERVVIELGPVAPNLPHQQAIEQFFLIGFRALDETDKENLFNSLCSMLSADKYRNLDIVTVIERKDT